ncbi:hypothetical protein BpHYR1_001612 [Brachionus plicatilis]|uniref:Uncharacterized protein n=1 Tax=Brachionus plicatilis TaxID=10195 RepID=A0A3M7QAS4_BRAPC|nr:hypothetical protein BpHYR1_001612 [Brachionus plicatilis]
MNFMQKSTLNKQLNKIRYFLVSQKLYKQLYFGLKQNKNNSYTQDNIRNFELMLQTCDTNIERR